MQNVYGCTGNLGNECADHAAALGSLGLISSHNLASRWVRRNFDMSACCGDCINISEILENCSTLDQMQRQHLKMEVSAVFHHRVLCVSHVHICVIGDLAVSLFFSRAPH